METADGAFTGEDKAGQDSCVPKSGGEQLVHTDGGLHIATALRPNTCQNSGGAFGMSADNVFGMVQAMQEIDFVLQGLEGAEGRAKFKLVAAAARPPFRGMNTVAKEQESEPFGDCIGGLNTEETPGFQPWQSDRCRCRAQNNTT